MDSSQDSSIFPNVGKNITIHEKLGKGGFGTVHRCRDENNKEMAVKIVESCSTGVNFLTEMAIMSTFRHPHLQYAYSIYSRSSQSYIIQELAKSDLSKWVKREMHHLPDIPTLRKWCFSIADAVSCLHTNNIIHGDIKASNVLLFDNMDARLSDFSISLKKIDTVKRTSQICTSTHRPLEVWNKSGWDTPADIWSLACTFYEIAFGDLLFTYQGHDCKDSNIIRDRSIANILLWGGKAVNILDFNPYRLHERYHGSEYDSFRDLLHAMLQINPEQRPAISQVLQHDFFQKNAISAYKKIHIDIPSSKKSRIYTKLRNYTSDEDVVRHSAELYGYTSSLGKISKDLRLYTCAWIASKILAKGLPSEVFPNHVVFPAERDICDYLGYRILLHKNDTQKFEQVSPKT